MTSSTNERQVKARQAQAARDRITDELVTKNLMSSYDGRRWVWLRLEEAAMFHEDLNFEVGYMAFAKGKRVGAQRLLADVQKFSPTEYISMVNEAQAILAQITKKDPNYVGSDDDGISPVE